MRLLVASPAAPLGVGVRLEERGYFAFLSLFHARLSCIAPRLRLRKDTGQRHICQLPGLHPRLTFAHLRAPSRRSLWEKECRTQEEGAGVQEVRGERWHARRPARTSGRMNPTSRPLAHPGNATEASTPFRDSYSPPPPHLPLTLRSASCFLPSASVYCSLGR